MKKFSIIKDHSEIINFFKHAKKNSYHFRPWNFNGHVDFFEDCFLSTISTRSKYMIFSSGSLTQLNNLLTKKKINLYNIEEQALIQLQIVTRKSDSRFQVKVPTLIAKIEKRCTERLIFNNDENISFLTFSVEGDLKVRELKFEKRILDVSTGGISIIVNSQEALSFKIGDLIEKVKVKILGKELECSIEVVNILEIEPNAINNLLYKGKKISFKFFDFSDSNEQFIKNALIKRLHN